jgi:hypothetical protein
VRQNLTLPRSTCTSAAYFSTSSWKRRWHQRSTYSDANVANRNSQGFRVGDRSRGRFATPADFPLHDGTSYWGATRTTLGCGICPSFKGHSRPVPNPKSYDSRLSHRCITSAVSVSRLSLKCSKSSSSTRRNHSSSVASVAARSSCSQEEEWRCQLDLEQVRCPP